MKFIENGKAYDTDTATKVAQDTVEVIYITQKGNWFKIIDKYSFLILTADEAFEWLECNNEADAIKEYFPGKIEDA